jgi:hypothetical protein
MGRVDADSIADAVQIFLARQLREAQEVEDLLTEDGIDYAVEVEAYARSFLFGSIRYGAAFYVDGFIAAACRQRLAAAGFHRGIVEEERDEATDR